MAPGILEGLPAAVQDRIKSAKASVAPSVIAPVVASADEWFPEPAKPSVALSAEQQKLLDVVAEGRDAIVDACLGSGKTTAIQQLCAQINGRKNVLYLTYSKLLKRDALQRVGQAKVQNFHGIVYPWLLQLGINCGIGESIARFNENFASVAAAGFPRYDVLVVDEYQDLTEEYAQLLRNIKSLNPAMQVVLVGDMEQKVRSDTVLDVAGFVGELCDNPVQVPFTQSFRMGPELGELLGEAWNKPVVGVNVDQVVKTATLQEALDLIEQCEPGDLLCLGSRNGQMSDVLNTVEKQMKHKFNKNTVYASIRDGDANAEYGPGTAVFTTFDSSKGLERKVVIVFDYDEGMWDMRNGFPGVDPIVMRNVFLVAASRGKEQIVFVRGKSSGESVRERIGFIPVDRFTSLPETQVPIYDKALWASDCFDFKYAENVAECFGLLERRRLDQGTGFEIRIERTDGLIDLSPAVGHYQEALYFEGYDPKAEVKSRQSSLAKTLMKKLGKGAWKDSLVLTAVDTDQLRYAEQVSQVVSEVAEGQLRARLATALPADCAVQVPVSLKGWAGSSESATEIEFRGVMDAMHEGVVYELKFTTELSHAMFLQLGLYLAMSGVKTGVLWNTRTDERWVVRVPDRTAFLDAVVKCVSKQYYDGYSAVEPLMGDDAAEWGVEDDAPVW